MPETVLLLDLEAQERCLDLRRVSQLVLGDLGATVQILQMAERECGNDDRPNRIEDCISDLGVYSCLEAVSHRTVAGDRRHSAVAAMWAHSREIAQHSRLIAEDTPDINPDKAHLVGLLHAIGLLPSVLGWDVREMDAADGALEGYKMAKRLSLPGFVLEFFSEMLQGGSEGRWSEIMQLAHRRAAHSSIHCPFGREVRPVLCRTA
jgi:hypothetical protein